MKRTLVSYLCIAGLVGVSADTSAQPIHDDEVIVDWAYQAIEHAILRSGCKENPMVKIDGLILLLSDIDTDKSRALLARLTSYYHGSARGEALTYAVARHGRKILDNLREELVNPSPCEITYDKCTCLATAEKQSLINRLIKIIEEDTPIYYVM